MKFQPASACLLLTSICLLAAGHAAGADAIEQHLTNALGALDPSKIATGILYDRVLPLSGIESYDGRTTSRPATLITWKQIYHEMFNASLYPPTWPDASSFLNGPSAAIRQRVIPIALMRFDYERIRDDALADGLLRYENGRLTETGVGNPFAKSTVFAATALKDVTYRGGRVAFTLESETYFSNDDRTPRLQIDFDDGRGFRHVALGVEQVVNYGHAGQKTIRVRADYNDGAALEAAFYFEVVSLRAPMPHDTLMVTASIPHNGEFGTGEAYVFRSDLNSTLKRPVILVEGFDIGNDMNWDELYVLMNAEGLLDSLRDSGYDAVVLNFTDAVDFIERNAFALVDLIEQVQAIISPTTQFAIVGASMGGLVSRYALAYMENNSLDHRVQTFVSFDAPQNGANIPLGVQHWVEFFSGQSAEAADLLVSLNAPAARQMLVYHHTKTPPSVAGPDPLRVVLESDLVALGNYPSLPRKVAVANGSGAQLDQGFSPGEQLVQYQFNSLLVDITGNVWAVSSGPSQLVFDGLIDIFLFPDETEMVSVSGTMPYDHAPGGHRGTMKQMDDSEAPFGDIVALHDDHCFIPTVSALHLTTTDLFYNAAGDPNLLALTPFDQVYFPIGNQGHVMITPENVQWFLAELRSIPTHIPIDHIAPKLPLLGQNSPNPFNPVTAIGFVLPRAGHTKLEVFSVDGRRVTTLVDERLAAGPHEIEWNAQDNEGRQVTSGIYFYRLETGAFIGTRKMILLK